MKIKLFFYKHLFIFTCVFLTLYNLSAFPKSTENTKKPRVGLVLSGGGARGFAHIGVIKVLEEEGIDVDVIGGTSMGSIVGGLYAMGYSIYEIEKMALTQDWNYILNDNRNRRDLGLYEKYDDEVHIFSLGIKGRNISIPPGLVYGQNVTHLLSELTSPAFQTKDFKNLNKPFFCMATDLLSGKAVKMDTGNLALAIRASMSVPSAFAPVKYGPYYLVDGGIINNFPAEEVKNLGADILIGVDIQTPLLEQSEINNLIQVLSQSIFLNAEENFNHNLSMIDLLIKPEIDPFTALDFDRADSLIARGEKKAREMIPQIRAFMQTNGLKATQAVRTDNAFPEMDMLYVDQVVIRGNKKVSQKYLMKELRVTSGDQISMIDLNERINRLYGTKLFYTINYTLEYTNSGQTIIFIDIEEATLFDINVGAHYNDYAKAGLLLNLTARNFGLPNGRFSVDLALGKVTRFSARYVVDKGTKLGFGSDVNAFNQLGFSYDEFGKKLISFDLGVFRSHGFGLITIDNTMRFRLGYELESNNIKPNISIIDFDKIDNLSGNIFADIFIDTYDRAYFPNSGFSFVAKIETGGGENTNIVFDDNGQINYPKTSFSYSALTSDLSGVIKIDKNLSLIPSLYFYKLVGDSVTLTKMSSFGGFTKSYIYNYRPFPGYEYMEIESRTSLYSSLGLRYNFWQKHYLSAIGNFLSADFDFNRNFEDNRLYYGWQVQYSYYSMIGPISLSVAKAYPKNRLVFDFSLGFWF